MLTLLLNTDLEKEAKALEGTFANYSHFDFMIEEDAWIFTRQGFFARFLPNVLPTKASELALPVMASVTKPVTLRGSAVYRGSLMPDILDNGKLSRTNRIPKSVVIASGAFSDQLGFLDAKKGGERRGTHLCRATSWTQEKPWDYEAILPALDEVSLAFREELPDLYAAQCELVRRAGPFHIQGTPYSTVNCNRDWQCAYHKDKYDLRDGWSAIFALGDYTGGELVFPRYHVAFNLRPGDVLFFDPHQIHGNLPFAGQRLTGVLFGRERIASCGGR